MEYLLKGNESLFTITEKLLSTLGLDWAIDLGSNLNVRYGEHTIYFMEFAFLFAVAVLLSYKSVNQFIMDYTLTTVIKHNSNMLIRDIIFVSVLYVLAFVNSDTSNMNTVITYCIIVAGIVSLFVDIVLHLVVIGNYALMNIKNSKNSKDALSIVGSALVFTIILTVLSNNNIRVNIVVLVSLFPLALILIKFCIDRYGKDRVINDVLEFFKYSGLSIGLVVYMLLLNVLNFFCDTKYKELGNKLIVSVIIVIIGLNLFLSSLEQAIRHIPSTSSRAAEYYIDYNNYNQMGANIDIVRTNAKSLVYGDNLYSNFSNNN